MVEPLPSMPLSQFPMKGRKGWQQDDRVHHTRCKKTLAGQETEDQYSEYVKNFYTSTTDKKQKGTKK